MPKHYEPHGVSWCRHKAYALTCEEFDELQAKAQGACARCGGSDRPLWIDHDHEVGRWAVRGLICPSCNVLMREYDAGRRESDELSAAFAAAAWHLTRDLSARAARKFPRAPCPVCGGSAAYQRSGRLLNHFDGTKRCLGSGRHR